MKESNCFITDKNQQVIFIGENVLRYVDYNTSFCYPAGKIEKGDIFILVSACQDDFSFLSQQFGIKSQSIKFSSNAIVIGKINSSDESTIIKKDFPQNTEPWLSVIYERKRIQIEKHSKSIDISINEQKILLDLTSNNQALVIINESGIKFFKFSKGNIKSDLLELSQEKFFKGFFNSQISRKLVLKDVIPSSLYQAFNERKEYVQLGNELIYLSAKTLFLEKDYYFYCLEAVDNIKENIISENQKLRNITNIEKNSEYEKIQYNNFRLWGEGSNLKQLEKRLQKGSVTNATILLTGESGTGKTFLAKEIHNASKRKNKPFIHVNCAAIPSQLIESELFGYEEGAFSGAKRGGKKGF